MMQDRLCELSVLSIENDIARSLDFSALLSEFTSLRARQFHFSQVSQSTLMTMTGQCRLPTTVQTTDYSLHVYYRTSLELEVGLQYSSSRSILCRLVAKYRWYESTIESMHFAVFLFVFQRPRTQCLLLVSVKCECDQLLFSCFVRIPIHLIKPISEIIVNVVEHWINDM